MPNPTEPNEDPSGTYLHPEWDEEQNEIQQNDEREFMLDLKLNQNLEEDSE